ncbi:uncharacterized protein LOC112628594 [Theropithecus gelada]|uniref:uncharacterized protein LOC112628594 n=1 Tax=Theropithecus gelada TaxID=9565 RepID=UPI000DC1B946|nr:uncharacterized protein LOC112628594 [Theropithecus gelada]
MGRAGGGRRLGLSRSELAATARASAPPLGAAARLRLGPLHSAPRVPEETQQLPHRTLASLPAPPAALRPLRSHPYVGPRRPGLSDAASPHSGGDSSDNPQLARGTPRPSGPHPSGPPLRPLVGVFQTRPKAPGCRDRLPIGSQYCRSGAVPTSASLFPFLLGESCATRGCRTPFLGKLRTEL